MKRFTKKVAVFLLSFLVVLSGMVTPSPVSAEAATEQSENQTFIEKGASWKYLDDGSDQGTAWKEENFDDSIWKSGAAPLGFKYDVKTTVSYGPDKDNKYITTYFRSNFEVKDTALVKTLKASVFLDDAAVFYINGKEIHRENMPEGNVDYKTLSKDSLGTVKNDVEFDVDPTVLKQGTNTIAVEVHQRSADSSDLVFDMNLISNKKDEPSPSQPEPTNDAIKDITFAPGKDASQVNFTWYSKSDSEPQVQIAPKSDAAGSDFPTDKSQTFKGEKSEGSYGYYSDKVTVTGLKQATEYVYRVGDGTNWSSMNTYTTQDISKGFNFLFAGDPQIGAGGDIDKDTTGWVDTVNKAAEKFSDSSFLLSIGDQVNNGKEITGQSNELEYDEYFRPQQLRNLPVAAIAGNHENGGVGHITHFNTPNMSDKYGLANEGTGSDYYYVYGNTLFMMLNSNDKNLEDHKTFMEEAIDANPNVTWKIVSMHHAVYSSANHETDDDIIARRNTYPQAFEQLGIDVVLDGHDHSYTRTYQMLGGKAVSTAGDTKVTNPKGVLYVTANSASGSKYYELQEPNENNYYEAKKEQIHVPTFSDVSITDDSFTINTYRTDTMEVTDSYTIEKSDEPTKPSDDAIKDITFAPGKDTSQANFTWYSKSASEPQVQIALKSDVKGSDFPAEKSQTFKGEKSSGNNGYYSDKATVTGLKQATEYVYRVGDGTNWSSMNTYTTQDISKGFNFLFAGDPQIGAGGDIDKDTTGWVDTVNKAAEKFSDSSFLLSIGDQVNNGKEITGQSNELEYDGFFKPEQLKNIPVAAIAGNHEGYGTGHSTHFNYPNMSDKYGIFTDNGHEQDHSNGTTGNDYYFVYGNTLFMMLNSNDINAEDHKAFMEEAIDANPNVKWKVVSMHHSIYSSANHETDADIAERRNTHPEVFEKLGIDVVLDGHDHCYTRTYQMLGGKAVSAAGDTKITNPKGVLYVTANSASGSKYYELQEPDQNNYYEAKKEQLKVPTFSDVSITDDSFTINTYRTDTMEATDSYTISKPSSSGGSSGGSGGSSSGSSVNVKNSNADSVVNSIKKAKNNASINIDVNDNKKISKDIFEAAKGTDKKLVFKADNIEWTFNGNDISTSKDVDMTADIAAIKDSASPNKQSIEDKVQDTDVYVASFFNNGELPGKSTVKIKLDGNWLKDKDKNTLNVYYYNESSKALNSIESGLKADSDNCIEFDISHTSDYIISDKKLISQEQVRLGGSDRYETSAKISQNKWTNADAAVLVSGEAFADALSSVPFAKQLNAPVLLTSSNSLNKNTASELSRLKVKKVYIIGGTGVISDLVENSIKDMNISTERIAGADRYSTSLAVAKKLGTPAQIFLCSGANFPDGLSVSSYAALSSSPVILTNGNEMESDTAKFIGDSNARVYVIGGNGVVKDSLLQGISNTERISGTDRYSTNLAVLAKFSDKFDLSNVYLASGKDFADALCGSAAAGQEKAPIILLDSILSDNVKNYIKDKKSNVNEVNILGGEGVIPQSIVDQLLQ